MRATFASSVGLFLSFLASSAGAGEPSEPSPGARLGLPANNASIVRAQDGEPVPPPLAPPANMALPTLGRPMKINATDASKAEANDADVSPARFLIPNTVKQPPAAVAPQDGPKPVVQPPVDPVKIAPATPGANPFGPTGGAPAGQSATVAVPGSGLDATHGCLGTGCYDCGTQHGRCYGSAEYLLWRFRDHHTPPLVTTGTVASGGILGREGTAILYGGNIDAEEKNGGRLTVGYWCDDCRNLGVEGTFFYFAKDDDGFEAFSPGSPVLARPFANVFGGVVPGTAIVLTPGEDAELVAFPAELAGAVNVRLTSKLWGGEINVRKAAMCGTGPNCTTYNVDALCGFRYVRFEEDLTIDENLVTLAIPGDLNPTPLGTNIEVIDSFRTRNQFFGGQVGAVAEFRRGQCFLNVRGKLGVGVNRQTVNIDGVTIFRLQDGTVAAGTGGLLAQPTNIGRYRNNEFSIMPEINGSIGYQLSENMRVFAGYSFLYWTNVVRPGDQIDRGINPTQRPTLAGPGTLVGPARPQFSFNQRDFWMHGLNLGVELKY